MAWLPHQRQSPLRQRNPNVPFYPVMSGQSPLAAMPGMVPNTGLNPILPLQLARNNRFNSPLFTGRAALGPPSAGIPFNSALQRGFYPPVNPALGLAPLPPPYDPYAYYPYNDPRYSSSSSSCCDNASNSNSKSDFDFKVKDVTVRGKARSVRCSYLLEAGKFEADLVKYMDKKKEDDVPDKVVDMLISWINREKYSNHDPFDEVTLNILASNVGCKSIMDHSLGRLKSMQDSIQGSEWVRIIGTVYLSSKVDEGLKKWLVKYLKEDRRYEELAGIAKFRKMCVERPEVEAEFMRGLGLWVQPDDKGLRTL
ncbi:hypothetical protein BKA61DRAFT_26110 [Leptodontidium sp. MPI-SDFR-AT-0119]|nr:hypothetical protein BKA61DRAFT_26110 [Leptodontidium sp. MPI-SDFR-AT-0119]